MVQSVMCAEQSASPARPVLVPVADVCTGLLELLAQVSDGRCDQGRDHPVAAVLALAAAATVVGMCGYTAMAGWVADVPAEVRRVLYTCTGGDTKVRPHAAGQGEPPCPVRGLPRAALDGHPGRVHLHRCRPRRITRRTIRVLPAGDSLPFPHVEQVYLVERAHTRSGPRILAALRNLAIGAFRLAGRHDITEATRWACRYMTRPFTILGLTL